MTAKNGPRGEIHAIDGHGDPGRHSSNLEERLDISVAQWPRAFCPPVESTPSERLRNGSRSGLPRFRCGVRATID